MGIILASASPRRQELLKLITNDFKICVADIDEESLQEKEPTLFCKTLATQKGEFIKKQYPNDIIIACDTVVDLDNHIFGKPKNEDEAFEIITNLSGKTHFVHTGVYIGSKTASTSFVRTSTVTFSKIPKEEILKYIKTTEPYDKAGGYGIQGWASKYISNITGCYFNILGFPIYDINLTLNNLL